MGGTLPFPRWRRGCVERRADRNCSNANLASCSITSAAAIFAADPCGRGAAIAIRCGWFHARMSPLTRSRRVRALRLCLRVVIINMAAPPAVQLPHRRQQLTTSSIGHTRGLLERVRHANRPGPSRHPPESAPAFSPSVFVEASGSPAPRRRRRQPLTRLQQSASPIPPGACAHGSFSGGAAGP